MARSRRAKNEVNAGSMADIAFLLLIFFLMTTTIASDKGLAISLPPKPDPNEPPPDVKFNERNIFKVAINSADNMAVEDERLDDISTLKNEAMEFILNFGNPNAEAQAFFNTLVPELKAMSKHDPNSSEFPTKPAVISFKTDRGTSYEKYINVLDELQGAFYEIYAKQLGVSVDKVREEMEPTLREKYNELKKFIPMNISIAEPTKIGGN